MATKKAVKSSYARYHVIFNDKLLLLLYTNIQLRGAHVQKSAYGETACRKSVWSEKRSARACGSPAAAVADNNPDISHLDAPLRRSLLLLLLVASVARPWLLSRSLSLCYISAFCGPLFVVWEFDTFFSTYLHGLRRRSFFFTWGKLHSISRPLQ